MFPSNTWDNISWCGYLRVKIIKNRYPLSLLSQMDSLALSFRSWLISVFSVGFMNGPDWTAWLSKHLPEFLPIMDPLVLPHALCKLPPGTRARHWYEGDTASILIHWTRRNFFFSKISIIYQWIIYHFRIYLEKSIVLWLHICHGNGYRRSRMFIQEWSSASNIRGEFCPGTWGP